jgi:hypothetical protein
MRFSDAFDVYPWFLGRDYDDHLYALTPAVTAIHDVKLLRAQAAPASAGRQLGAHHCDDVLLRAVLQHWERYFVDGLDTVEDRRLFRSLDMARAASKMPGGPDATIYDGGRAVALWVSAFEILAHDGHTDLKRVLALLGRVGWERPKLKQLDRTVKFRGRPIATNLAGFVYNALYRVRNAFLHGEPVPAEALTLQGSRISVLSFAAPLFRLALTAHLNLKLAGVAPDPSTDPTAFGQYVAERMAFAGPQRLAEDAILVVEGLGNPPA